jgi:hypothetical protein
MVIIIAIFFAVLNSLAPTTKGVDAFSGTWMSEDYIHQLEDSNRVLAEMYTPGAPRIIYVGDKGKCDLEYRFESSSSIGLPANIRRGDTIENDYSGRRIKFAIVLQNDSTLVLKLPGKPGLPYRRISRLSGCVQCGMQHFLNNMFWKGIEKWQLTDSAGANPVRVRITYNRIYIDSSGKLFTEFEFADAMTTKVNETKAFVLVFFTTVHYMIDYFTQYAIIRKGDIVYLFEDGKLKYMLKAEI